MKDKSIKDHMNKCNEKLRLFSVEGNLVPILLLASYCGEEDSKCKDTNPCEDCLKMCNIAFVEKEAIKSENVVCGYDFLKDYR